MTAAGPHTLAAAMPPEPFNEEVRAALDHLYDAGSLHNYALAWRLGGDAPASGITRAQRLRTLLLDAIEQLRPEPRLSTDEMRAYAILTYRCIDGMAMDEIAAKLGLSRRQAYRDYAKGVDAVAAIVWDALAQITTPPAQTPAVTPALTPETSTAAKNSSSAEPATRLDAAAQEVARLANNLTLAAVDLAAVAVAAADLLAPRTQRSGVVLRLAADAALPPVVADRTLLRQALLNLFSYALDQACRGGEVAVTSVQTERAAGLAISACAADAGAQASAAAPASAANAGAESPARREGVGVSVAQQLIEAMGGEMRIEPAAHEWRCTLLLPVARRDTVLVVDDNADLTALFQRYAAGHALDVVGATDGAQALALAAELRPQLIILDLMLAPLDGWEILQQLRADAATRTTPIVICSVLNEQELAYSLGASDYVAKPISQAALIDVLQRWLGKPHPPA